MKKNILSVLTIAFLAIGCSKEEAITPSINASDFTKTVDENLATNTEIGTLTATGNDGVITYSLVSQIPIGAIAVSNDGKITVADATKFDFETNPKIEATVKVKSTNTSKDIKVTINLNDIDDLLVLLTTSKTKYKNATNGNWIIITKAEYDNLAVKLNSVTKGGLSDSNYNKAPASSSGVSNFTRGNPTTEDVTIPANSYVFAFKYKIKRGTNITNSRVKISTAKQTGYINIGGKLPSHSGANKDIFFLLKGNTTKNTKKGYLAMYSQANTTLGISSSSFFYNGGDKSSLPNNYGKYYNYFQSLNTTKKQW